MEISKKKNYFIIVLICIIISMNVLGSCTNQIRKPRECSVTVIYQDENYVPLYDYYLGVYRPLKSVIDFQYDVMTMRICSDNTISYEPFENTEHLSFLHQLFKKRYEGAIAVLKQRFENYNEEFFQYYTVRVGGNTTEHINLPNSSLVIGDKEYILLERKVSSSVDERGKAVFCLLSCDNDENWEYIGEYNIDVKVYATYKSRSQLLSKHGEYLCICGEVWINTITNLTEKKPKKHSYYSFDSEDLKKSIGSFIESINNAAWLVHSWQIDQVNYSVFQYLTISENGRTKTASCVSETTVDGQLLRLIRINGMHDDKERYDFEMPFELF